ncbi:7147_t:CDS:1, partial [Racocetra persica]
SDNQIPKIATLKSYSQIDLHKAQFWGHLAPQGDIWRVKGKDAIFVNLKWLIFLCLNWSIDPRFIISLNDLLSARKRSFANKSDLFPSHLLSIPNEVQENSNLYIFQLIAEAPFQ